MLEFLAANLSTILISIVLLAIVVLISIHLVSTPCHSGTHLNTSCAGKEAGTILLWLRLR